MWILIAALPVGLLLGLIAGGSFDSLREIQLRTWYLLIPAFAIVILMSLDRDPPGEWILLPTALVLFAIVSLRNIATVGMAIVGIGVIANLVPVLMNGEMPVREKAIVQAGLADWSNIDLVQLGAGRRFEKPGDIVVQLGAIVPLKAVKEVMTFGDLIVIAGLVNVGFRSVKLPSGRHRRDDPEEPASNLSDALDIGTRSPFAPPRSTHVATPAPELVDLTDSTVPIATDDVGATVDLRDGSDVASRIDLFADDLPRVVRGSASWGE